MKKLFLLLAFSVALYTAPVFAQSKKKADDDQKTEAKKTDAGETDKPEDRHAREKAYWKKVGNDQKEFWKEEHERHVKGEGPRKPPPPPNPFKRKKKKDMEEATNSSTGAESGSDGKSNVQEERSGPRKPPPPPNPFKKKKKKDAEKEEATSDSGSK
ncbi:hypothetical protein A8C56_19225 [Niabella ginsenosidivorans]|uniref:Uncharacterized protein n=1 Tax=Niabella ginsenosidivorans TaxID=1176587 RepID=A0A1A9I802_9BACT|nr:hypothetical protein [Niabella ginsenosidivorans]ANH82830.1 hypothetical protein A8C56_19225 [Niabella ginsenosidivorans]